MKQSAVKEKVKFLESELELLKRAFFKEPDFDIDEKNWQAVKLESKRIRKKIYKDFYGKK